MFHEILKEKPQNLVTEARKIHSQERDVLINSLRRVQSTALKQLEQGHLAASHQAIVDASPCQDGVEHRIFLGEMP